MYDYLAELGDFNPHEHQMGYLSNMQLLADQTVEAERKISELHKLHRGQLPADAEYNYLEHAKRLDLYGIDLHKAIVIFVKRFYIFSDNLFVIIFSNRTQTAKNCNWASRR